LMAEVNFFDSFEEPWAQNGDVEAIQDNQYKAGWAYIGATPPSVEQFNKVQQLSDQKAAWLFAQMKELAEQGGYALTAEMEDALTRGIAASVQGGAAITGVDTGSANTYVVSYSPAITALADGMVLRFKVKTGNTGASTLNVNGLGAQPLVGGAHSALQGGELAANGKADAVWRADISSWVLLGCTGGAVQVSPATKSAHAMRLDQATGRLLGVQIFTASGTYTPGVYSGVAATMAIVKAVGGGGGGGGCAATGPGQCAVAGSGNAGGYGEIIIYPGSLTSQSVTIGAAGAGGAAGINAGGVGGTTSFGALLHCAGGGNGGASAAGTPPLANFPVNGGSTVTGSGIFLVKIPGSFAQNSFALSATVLVSGAGANSPLGTGGNQAAGAPGANAGGGYGGGGSGAGIGSSSPASAGGSGGPGVVIVYEYA
jgi:hypothetical protein